MSGIVEAVICRCGWYATPGYKTCADCREYQRQYMIRHRWLNLRPAGKCQMCGVRPPKRGRVTCEVCLDRCGAAAAKKRTDAALASVAQRKEEEKW